MSYQVKYSPIVRKYQQIQEDKAKGCWEQQPFYNIENRIKGIERKFDMEEWKKENKSIDVIIPVYRPESTFLELLFKLKDQTKLPEKIILMHTEDEKGKQFLEENKVKEIFDNIEVYEIKKNDFDHGKTRDEGILKSQAEFFLCMTQDAIPADNYMIERLVDSFEDPQVVVAYGRQLPRKDCHILETYTRIFNYPEKSKKKTIENLEEMGIKTFFCSNVCAMYRREAYDKLGGFIKKTIFNEDMIYAGKAIKEKYAIQYQAQAKVFHSHNYTGIEQLKRNFDLGVSQTDNSEIFAMAKSEKEGKKLIYSMLRVMKKNRKLYLAPKFFYHSGCKYLGYKLGKSYKKLPLSLIKIISMNPTYWK